MRKGRQGAAEGQQASAAGNVWSCRAAAGERLLAPTVGPGCFGKCELKQKDCITVALSCGLVPNRDSPSPSLLLVPRELRAGIVVASGKRSGHC